MIGNNPCLTVLSTTFLQSYQAGQLVEETNEPEGKKYNDLIEVTDKLILKCIKHIMDRMVHVLQVVSDCDEYIQIEQPRFGRYLLEMIINNAHSCTI